MEPIATIKCGRCGGLLVPTREAIGLIVAAKAKGGKAQKTCHCGQTHELEAKGKPGVIVATRVLL